MLPDAINIDGHVVEIREAKIDDEEGNFSPVNNLITLKDDLVLDVQRRILMHEVTHAFIYYCCRSYSDCVHNLRDKDKIEELTAEQIGERMYRVLDDNPQLRKYLLW